MKISTFFLILLSFLFSQPEPDFELFPPGWSWNNSTAIGHIILDEVTLFGETPDHGFGNDQLGFCPEGDECDLAAAFYNSKCIGAAYYIDDEFYITVNFNDFVTDGVEEYPMAGGTVSLKIFDADEGIVYHSIIQAQVFPLSQAQQPALDITGDGESAGAPYGCPETESPYFEPYANGGDLNLCGKGDVNLDEMINVLDVVMTANFIIGIQPPLPYLEYLADTNRDDEINVLDVMEIVIIILEQ